jgi:hypothetical protein
LSVKVDNFEIFAERVSFFIELSRSAVGTVIRSTTITVVINANVNISTHLLVLLKIKQNCQTIIQKYEIYTSACCDANSEQ